MFYIVFEVHRIGHISATKCQIQIKTRFGSKFSFVNGQVVYIEKPKVNIGDMWLIPLDRATYFPSGKLQACDWGEEYC